MNSTWCLWLLLSFSDHIELVYLERCLKLKSVIKIDFYRFHRKRGYHFNCIYIFLVYLIFSRAMQFYMNTKQIAEITQLVQSIEIMQYSNIPATVDLSTKCTQQSWESFICENTFRVETNMNNTWIYTTPVSLLTKNSTSFQFQTMFSCFIRVFAHQRNVISSSSSLNCQSNSYSIQRCQNIVHMYKVPTYKMLRIIGL